MVTGHRLWRGNWQSLGHKEVGNWEALGVWAQQPGEAGLLLGVEAAGSQSSERPLDPAGEGKFSSTLFVSLAGPED